ncbi:MAG: SusC/RagA family TonB-linked outer membrane protein [Mangrovibacterium sp.]
MDRSFGASVSGFSNNTTENYNLGAAETINTPSSSYSEWVLASWLGRVNYSFKNRYLLTASIRADGSSRFGSNHKWGTFPSAAFAWRISDEAFMADVAWISDLKFRASYGITGSTALSPYQSLDLMSSVKVIYANQQEEVGFVPARISNDDLKWEKTAQADIGFDLGVLDNRFRLTADYYKKNTTDLLASVPLPPSVGFGSVYQNVGEIQNQGFEFSLFADILRNQVKWNVSANFSTNRNKVIEIAGGSDLFSSGQGNVWSSTNIAREGEPWGVFFGYIEDGLDDKGFIKYKDQLTVDSDGDDVPDSADGIINSADRVILGNPHPDFFYGLNSNLAWKNFELNVILEGVYGSQIFNSTNGTHLNSFQRGSTQFRDIIGNYWTTENPDPNAKYPKISSATSFQVSDRFIESGSYLRVKSIRLAYNLPVKKLGIPLFDFAQVYVSGSNLFTFTNYTGLDPEVNTKGDDSSTNISDRLNVGYDQSSYPNAKTYAIGLKLNF